MKSRGVEGQVLALLEELAVREDVPADVRERALALAETLRPSPESARVLAEMAELVRRLG